MHLYKRKSYIPPGNDYKLHLEFFLIVTLFHLCVFLRNKCMQKQRLERRTTYYIKVCCQMLSAFQSELPLDYKHSYINDKLIFLLCKELLRRKKRTMRGSPAALSAPVLEQFAPAGKHCALKAKNTSKSLCKLKAAHFYTEKILTSTTLSFHPFVYTKPISPTASSCQLRWKMGKKSKEGASKGERKMLLWQWDFQCGNSRLNSSCHCNFFVSRKLSGKKLKNWNTIAAQKCTDKKMTDVCREDYWHFHHAHFVNLEKAQHVPGT